MDKASNSLKMTQLFTRGRHGSLSVIYFTQNLFHNNQLNSDYMVVFKNIRDNSQFATIARQIHTDKVNFFMWAYKDATLSPHTYLMLDLKPDTEERFQVQSNTLEACTKHVYKLTDREKK